MSQIVSDVLPAVPCSLLQCLHASTSSVGVGRVKYSVHWGLCACAEDMLTAALVLYFLFEDE